ncbi:response regulator [Ramlibacter humi]|uniref:Response regulator n=1 Tax=Ramlibacter humi TaxID=2530451 RepID=A0A4Z0BDP4_9BURK|nr:response regulator [Ramlibacter humi]TFY96593.1 response regulator [Ramlibacter humi]
MFHASCDSASKQLTVLVADDNKDAADTLSDLLTISGHTVLTAYDGLEALLRADDQPDVAILDLGMPGLGGWEVARRLRGRRPDMLLIAASGWGSTGHQAESIRSGFDLHLTKPVDPVRLLALLEAKAARAVDAEVSQRCSECAGMRNLAEQRMNIEADSPRIDC